jgi:hypothetical protein
MYTRHNNNTIKLKVKSDVIANCTYLRFQNGLGGKWYYAFINAINYINENTTEVVFEIDVVQIDAGVSGTVTITVKSTFDETKTATVTLTVA